MRFDKNFVKTSPLLKNLLRRWFHEKVWCENFAIFHTAQVRVNSFFILHFFSANVLLFPSFFLFVWKKNCEIIDFTHCWTVSIFLLRFRENNVLNILEIFRETTDFPKAFLCFVFEPIVILSSVSNVGHFVIDVTWYSVLTHWGILNPSSKTSTSPFISPSVNNNTI